MAKKRTIGALVALAVCAAGFAGVQPAYAAVPAPVLHYNFDGQGQAGTSLADGFVFSDHGSSGRAGTVVNSGATLAAGPSGSSDVALSLPGGANTAAAPHVRIAPGVVPSGQQDVTLSAWVRWSGAPACTWPFTLGASQTQHVFATTQCGSFAYGAINQSGETRATGTAPAPAGRWAHLAVVVDGGTSVSTYLNGVRVGHANTTRNAGAAVGTATFSGYLGKSFYAADAYWNGVIDDFKVYTDALTGEQLIEAELSVYQAIAIRDAAITIGDLSAVTADLTLPTVGPEGASLTWASTDTSVISTSGAVTRPAHGQGNATVYLTPTATIGDVTIIGAPRVATVLEWAEGDGPEAALARAVAAALADSSVFAAPVRGSLTLPENGADVEGLDGVRGVEDATIAWSSSDDAVVSGSDQGSGPNVVKKGSVTRGAADATVTLTASVTVEGADPVEVDIPLQVPADPGVEHSDFEAYMFAYFTADNIAGEKIRFATSDGDDALNWKLLNNAQPVLESFKGTMGLRDPFIMRSHEGDRFFLLATDLSVGRSGWGNATRHGSHYLEVWESTDLVNWSEQRHIKVNVPTAGMTWAPEAFYDPTIDAYVVYFTSTMYTDETRAVQDGNGPQIVTTITRDFRTFTPPVPWFKAADVPGLVPQNGLIDSTILKDGDTYYRFTKATQSSGCPSPDIIGQKSTDLRATTASGAWELFDLCIGRNAGTPEVEGPSAFLANDGDVNGNRYYLWVDNYGGRGYIPLMTNSLEGDPTWIYPPTFSLPASPRHGSVIGITREERDALADKWAKNLLVSSVAPVALDVEVGATQAALPGTVTATFADGHTESVRVDWDDPDLSQLQRNGDQITVEGALANGAATRAVATLTAFGATELELSVSAQTRCVAGKVVLAASVTNNSEVAAEVGLVSAYGSKSFASVAPGATVSAAFTSRLVETPAGSVAVTASAAVDGATVSAQETGGYALANCAR
ncbi:MAG TPA: family 43 glycosylhydrolase [Arachnia sp.]|nr:family 43 glycosylhydrolase [Arachnia sp.]